MRKVSTLVGVGVLALSLLQGAVPPPSAAEERSPQPSLGQVREGSGAEALIVGSLGTAEAVDVFELNCTGTTSRCARADVRDTGPFNDTRFSVTLVGRSGVIFGRADTEISPAGGLSADAVLCRPTNGTLSTFVVIAEANQRGQENYDSEMTCVNAFGFPTAHSVISRQNQ